SRAHACTPSASWVVSRYFTSKASPPPASDASDGDATPREGRMGDGWISISASLPSAFPFTRSRRARPSSRRAGWRTTGRATRRTESTSPRRREELVQRFDQFFLIEFAVLVLVRLPK